MFCCKTSFFSLVSQGFYCCVKPHVMIKTSLRVERIHFSSQFVVHRPGKTRQNSQLEPGGRICCGGYGGYGGTLSQDWPS